MPQSTREWPSARQGDIIKETLFFPLTSSTFVFFVQRLSDLVNLDQANWGGHGYVSRGQSCHVGPPR